MNQQDRDLITEQNDLLTHVLTGLDKRVSKLEEWRNEDRAQIDGLETAVHELKEIVKQFSQYGDAIATIERAAEFVNKLADNWKRVAVVIAGVIAFAAFVIDAIRWLVLGWPF